MLDAVDITRDAPTEEPLRQYYYMAKLRDIVSRMAEAKGRPITADVITYGCQANARDSEGYAGILRNCGFEITEDETSDLVLYNTCSVRENADQRLFGHLGQMKVKKAKNPEIIVAVCGCMMQEKSNLEKIRRSFNVVDIIFGTHNMHMLAELLYKRITTGKKVSDVRENSMTIVEDMPFERKFPFKMGVNIMYGCNNFCTYCIVPYVRGRERSRDPEEILSEIRGAVSDGVIEVMLLGQNVNSYGKNLTQQISFAQLLAKTAEIPGLKRVRFMTSHPKDMSDELIETTAKYPKVCRHVHLPLQSGSDRILKAMNRHYTKADYMLLVKKLREAMPDISLTTDIIVGFPGETKEDFLQTMEIVREVKYDSAFTFIYSKRPGTPAARIEDGTPEEVIHERFDRL
ncbi:MAG: tRNA (N6-isopentenyl adenosine(37)-C2)-methylthiotransferase MiaB, partial [Lachnospiraceae bacterium]|nr:tRNA (N6-isopentenyl adenosine(37)-C2)-methylthiotransferase MiaB [Lachnospiraceae bacterium]